MSVQAHLSNAANSFFSARMCLHDDMVQQIRVSPLACLWTSVSSMVQCLLHKLWSKKSYTKTRHLCFWQHKTSGEKDSHHPVC